MTDISITLPAGTLIELALASVIPGMEAQYFEDFSPRFRPIAKEHGAVRVAHFNVMESMVDTATPTIGAFVQWPSLNAHRELNCDPRFMAIKNRRDETMSYLSAGHFFAVDKTTDVTIDADAAYAIAISSIDIALPEAVLSLGLSNTSPNMGYAGRTLTITKWTQEAQMFADVKQSDASVYKIIFNPADAG